MNDHGMNNIDNHYSDGYMEPEEEWEREGLLDPAWEKQQKKVRGIFRSDIASCVLSFKNSRHGLTPSTTRASLAFVCCGLPACQDPLPTAPGSRTLSSLQEMRRTRLMKVDTASLYSVNPGEPPRKSGSPLRPTRSE